VRLLSPPLKSNRKYITIRQAAEWLNPDVNPNKKSKCHNAHLLPLENGYYACETCQKAFQLLPKLYHRAYRTIVKAYSSGKWGDSIRDVPSGFHRALLIAEDILPDLFKSQRRAA
jgi:hypothetical protein